MDLALNNLQRLIYHKTQQTKPNLKTRSDKQENVPFSHLGDSKVLQYFGSTC